MSSTTSKWCQADASNVLTICFSPQQSKSRPTCSQSFFPVTCSNHIALFCIASHLLETPYTTSVLFLLSITSPIYVEPVWVKPPVQHIFHLFYSCHYYSKHKFNSEIQGPLGGPNTTLLAKKVILTPHFSAQGTARNCFGRFYDFFDFFKENYPFLKFFGKVVIKNAIKTNFTSPFLEPFSEKSQPYIFENFVLTQQNSAPF